MLDPAVELLAGVAEEFGRTGGIYTYVYAVRGQLDLSRLDYVYRGTSLYVFS